MKTNKIMDEIRSSISPGMKKQMELSVAIANRIYYILEAKGMSQKEFARMIGKTETEVSRWLSGTHNMTIATICKISDALEEDIIRVVGYSYGSTYDFEPEIAAEAVGER
ncbi:MAG: helix-turn-helix transcriptional regulator [Prevotella sp.]|nr:helix-turn-helix transcriptional regulator [Prevotella sp.]MBR1462141.1 helix-turn-helix transcriptional regulator [Prevotella sp.]